MAIVFTPTDRKMVDTQFGRMYQVKGTVAFDSSQLVTGEPYDPSQIGLSTIKSLIIDPIGSAAIGYLALADTTNKLVYVYKSAASAVGFPAADSADLSVVGAAVPFSAIGY